MPLVVITNLSKKYIWKLGIRVSQGLTADKHRIIYVSR